MCLTVVQQVSRCLDLLHTVEQPQHLADAGQSHSLQHGPGLWSVQVRLCVCMLERERVNVCVCVCVCACTHVGVCLYEFGS